MDTNTLATIGIIAAFFLLSTWVSSYNNRKTVEAFTQEWGAMSRAIVAGLPAPIQSGIRFVETATDKGVEIGDKILPEKLRDAAHWVETRVDDLVGEGESEPDELTVQAVDRAIYSNTSIDATWITKPAESESKDTPDDDKAA